MRQAEIDPAAFPVAVEQAGLGKQLQVPRQPRLALAENMDKVGDRQVGMGAKHQQPKPGRLGGRFHGGEKTVHGCPPGNASREQDAIIRI